MTVDPLSQLTVECVLVWGIGDGITVPPATRASLTVSAERLNWPPPEAARQQTKPTFEWHELQTHSASRPHHWPQQFECDGPRFILMQRDNAQPPALCTAVHECE